IEIVRANTSVLLQQTRRHRPREPALNRSWLSGPIREDLAAVRYLNKDNAILANILFVPKDASAAIFVALASFLVLVKNPQACSLQLPTLQLLTHCAHEGQPQPAALKRA